MRLIDADSLPIWQYTLAWEEGIGIQRCCEAVNRAPTVDAVPVVRCKYCRFSDFEFDDNDDNSEVLFYCTKNYDQYGFWKEVKGNDFCSYGEKKEDNNEM